MPWSRTNRKVLAVAKARKPPEPPTPSGRATASESAELADMLACVRRYHATPSAQLDATVIRDRPDGARHGRRNRAEEGRHVPRGRDGGDGDRIRAPRMVRAVGPETIGRRQARGSADERLRRRSVSRVRELHARAEWHVLEVRHVRQHDGVQLR